MRTIAIIINNKNSIIVSLSKHKKKIYIYKSKEFYKSADILYYGWYKK